MCQRPNPSLPPQARPPKSSLPFDQLQRHRSDGVWLRQLQELGNKVRRSHILKPWYALLLTMGCLSACRSAKHDTTTRGALVQLEPSIAANAFFTWHYDFYFEDPTLREGLLTQRFFRVLKHNYDTETAAGQIGALNCDPWINSQDGNISEPFGFKTIQSKNSEATVRFDYTFVFGPKNSVRQSVLMKFQRSSSTASWRLADFVMPNHESLLDLLERNP